MRTAFACAFVFAGCLVSVPASSPAQEVVHALTGTVSAINSAAKTITVFQDNGFRGVYNVLSDPKTRISFDRKIEAETTAADAFKNKGAYVIVFYFGDSQQPTVAALKGLGAGPFTSTVGTVEKFESHDHSISIADKSGAVHKFRIDSATVAETDMGAEEGLKFRAQTGDRVRVVSSGTGGNSTVLFLRDM